ncbi:MAG TPA: tetratricopeptide repeat protein [Candidatus Binatia bacterium]|nr:tetratricopeptide repeat protein [Candidatus Binatia bacterium]
MPSASRCVIIAALAFACYANTLRCGLVFDDLNAIVNNPAVRRMDVAHILTRPAWFARPVPIYRPVTTLSFALDHALHGVRPLGYHLVNVLLHAAVAVLAAAVVRRVTGDTTVAFVTALLFATHPVHTEAVTSVVGRAELLAALFGLAAWLAIDPRASLGRDVGAAILLLLSVLSKESGVTFLGVVALAAVLGRGPAPARRTWMLLVAAGVVAIALRAAVLANVPPAVPRLDNVAAAAPLGPRLMTAIGVLARYARVLAWPVHLAADHSYPEIPLVVAATDPTFLAGIGLLVATAAGIAWAWRHDRAVAFALAFTAVTFSVTANVLLPIGTIMAERLTYVPSLGFCLLVALALRTVGRKTAAVACVALVLAYAVRTVTRNAVWRDSRTFAEALVRDAPRSARSHRELGLVLAQAGEHDRGVAELRAALALEPHDAVTFYDLGNVELAARRFDDAIAAYRAALAERPDDADTLVNLGNVFSARGDEAEAASWFRRALDVAPDAVAPRVNLANALLRQGRSAEAEAEYRRAVALAPDDPGVRFLHGVCLESLRRFAEAIDEYRIARAGAPDSAPVAIRLTAALAAAGRTAEARAEQARAEKQFPNDPGVVQMRRTLAAPPSKPD